MPAQEGFGGDAGLAAPASKAAAVTPDDNNDLPYITRAIYIGSVAGGATLTVVMHDGTTVAFAGLLPGTVYPIRVARIKATGTLAASIVALW